MYVSIIKRHKILKLVEEDATGEEILCNSCYEKTPQCEDKL